MVAGTYLIASLITTTAWVLLYAYRKDLRNEMLVMSSIVAIFGFIMEALVWTEDWWRPITITGTLVGIEDLLFGFGLGGMTAVAYEELFKMKNVRKKVDLNHVKHLAILLAVSSAVGSFFYFVLGYNSFVTWTVSTTAATIVIYVIRPDLIIDSLATAFILTLFSIILFAILNSIEPGFVYSWWLFENLSGIIFLLIPLEDIIWFFTTGLFVGPIYEFWQGIRLQKVH